MLNKIRKGDMNISIDNYQDDGNIVVDINTPKKDVHKDEQSDNVEDMEDNSENDMIYLEQEMDEL